MNSKLYLFKESNTYIDYLLSGLLGSMSFTRPTCLDERDFSYETLMSRLAQARKDEKGVGCILLWYG